MNMKRKMEHLSVNTESTADSSTKTLPDEAKNDEPFSPYRAMQPRDVGELADTAVVEIKQSDTPPEPISPLPALLAKALTNSDLDDFWGSIPIYIRSVSELEEIDGAEKGVEMIGLDARDLHIGKHGFFVTSRKGSKGKSERVNQDAYSIMLLPTGQKISVVCDGHGSAGHKLAERVSRTLPFFLKSRIRQHRKMARSDISWAFDAAHYELIAYSTVNNIDSYQSGTTVSMVFSDEFTIWSGHSGDSRTALIKFSPTFALDSLWESLDHTPMREQKRILDHGGDIVVHRLEYDPESYSPSIESHSSESAASDSHPPKTESPDEDVIERVYIKDKNFPGLRLARAFGDLCLHSLEITTHEPSIDSISISQEQVNLAVIASDGVWEFAATEDVVKKIQGVLKTRNKLRLPLFEGIAKAGGIVMADSVKKWISRGVYVDDITVIITVV